MNWQRTVKKEVRVAGVGIHTGKQSKLCFRPAKPDSGINFVRVDLPHKPVISASVSNIVEKYLVQRRTTLGADSAEIHTVEHLLSCLFGLGVDNITIEVEGEEIPALDGAAFSFYNLLTGAGIVELDSPKKTFVVPEPVWLQEGDTFLAAFPEDNFRISYTLSYPEVCLNQYLDLEVSEETFARELSRCRTFCLESEVRQLRAHGLGQGATEDNTIVVGKNGVVKGSPTFPDEFARHKVLDLIGDLCLLSTSIKGHIVGVKSGHPLNIKLLRQLYQLKQKQTPVASSQAGPGDIMPPFDIEKIMQILPHRYPFLLVDRVLEFQEGRHIVGVKNVSINEQFFTGHFPGRPVMPGVLIIEAMAQTAGILMLSRVENRGKLAYFMTMDRVKFRQTVVPGDQLLLKVDVVKIKSRTILIHALACVEDKVVAEADLMFSLVAK